MKLSQLMVAAAVAVAAASSTSAAPFTPTFSEYTFPGSQFDVDATANVYYAENFGIEVSNAYLYKDSRDTFDGIGISAGNVSEIGTEQSGRIDFLDTTDFVTLEYFTLRPGVYSAFARSGSLIDTFNIGANQSGARTLSGGTIGFITFTGDSGYVQVSGLTYSYDGVTDGTNDSLSPVPLPASGFLLIGGLAALGALRKRFS